MLKIYFDILILLYKAYNQCGELQVTDVKKSVKKEKSIKSEIVNQSEWKVNPVVREFPKNSSIKAILPQTC